MTLLELQRKMATAVMQPLTKNYTMRKKTAAGKSMHSEAASFIKPHDRLTSFGRLEIYNRQYWFRLISAFSEDFPGLSAIVGEKKFDALAVDYLTENPSTSFTLRNLGSRLEQWLRNNPERFGNRHALAIDVVRLEWAYIESFDNAQLPPLSTRDMAALSETSRFSLQPHLRLLDLQHPVDDFIVEIHRNQRESDVASNAVTELKQPTAKAHPSHIRPRQIYLAVHRFDEEVYYKRLDHEAYLLLQSISKGDTLGDALESAFEHSTIPELDRPAQIQAWFALWAELGWLCQTHTTPADHIAQVA